MSEAIHFTQALDITGTFLYKGDVNKLPLLLITIFFLIPYNAFSDGFICKDIFRDQSRFTIEFSKNILPQKDDFIFDIQIVELDYGFYALLDENGTLKLDVRLQNINTGARSHLRGSELFAEMIQHFGRDRIKVIVGRWSEGTNYDAFYAELFNGASAEEAALRTWTGRMASSYGFDKVKYIEILNPYTEEETVYVEFTMDCGRLVGVEPA